MTTLAIDLDEAIEIASAATQQPWKLDHCGRAGDQSIADVGLHEVCAPQAPLWSTEHDEIHDRDALADARHIATFNPPMVLSLLHRQKRLEEAVAIDAETVHYLMSAFVEFCPADVVDAVLAHAPERVRPSLALLVPAPTLTLVEPA